MPKPFAAIIFDLDGTLVDTKLDFRAIRRELDFPENIGLLEHIATLDDPAAIAHARAVIDRHEMAGADSATWIDGADAVLQALKEQNIPTAVLTRNSRKAVNRVDEILGLDVPLILTREDCRPKPDPEGLLIIAQRLGVRPERGVYVGDFVFDLRCARNAGMAACLYRNPRNGHFADEADMVIEDLKEVIALTLD